MTQETRTRKVAETVEVEKTVTDYEAQTREESYTVTTCNWCGQEYADDEDVEFSELVQNPSAEPQLDRGNMWALDISTLLEVIEVYYAPDPRSDEWQAHAMMGGNARTVGEVDWESTYQRRPDTGTAIVEAIKDGVHRRGGPDRDWDSQIEAAFALDSRRTEYDQPKFLFKFQSEMEVEGETIHICEYCEENLDLPMSE